MPCYLRIQVSVEIKAENFNILLESLKASGAEVTFVRQLENSDIVAQYRSRIITIRNGAVVADERIANEAANAVNRTYSKQVVKQTARKYGWAYEENNQTGQIKLRR